MSAFCYEVQSSEPTAAIIGPSFSGLGANQGFVMRKLGSGNFVVKITANADPGIELCSGLTIIGTLTENQANALLGA